MHCACIAAAMIIFSHEIASMSMDRRLRQQQDSPRLAIEMKDVERSDTMMLLLLWETKSKDTHIQEKQASWCWCSSSAAAADDVRRRRCCCVE